MADAKTEWWSLISRPRPPGCRRLTPLQGFFRITPRSVLHSASLAGSNELGFLLSPATHSTCIDTSGYEVE